MHHSVKNLSTFVTPSKMSAFIACPLLFSPFLAASNSVIYCATHTDITPSFSCHTSNHLPSLPSLILLSLIQNMSFVIGQYLYQVGPCATWDNSFQSDPGHSNQNHFSALLGSVQSSPSAIQASFTDRLRHRRDSPTGIIHIHQQAPVSLTSYTRTLIGR